jgi:TRAP-type transport system periplasmic protein
VQVHDAIFDNDPEHGSMEVAMTTGIRKYQLTAACVMAGIAFGAIAGPAEAQRTVTISVLHGDDRPQAHIWHRFRDAVDEALPGDYDFRIVTGAALGGERETAEGVRLGSIQGGMSTLANMSAWYRPAQVFDMPFVLDGPEHIDAVARSDIGQSVIDGLVDEGFRGLGFVVYGARHLISTAPIRTPADVQGRNKRVIESPLHIELWRTLGANPTPVPIPEAYGALETGVVEMMDFTKTGYESFRLYEVAPYFTETAHIWSVGVLYFSEEFWQSLPEDHRAIFAQTAEAVIPLFNEATEQEHLDSMERVQQHEVEIIVVDRGEWREAILPFWESYADNVGGIDLVRRIADWK